MTASDWAAWVGAVSGVLALTLDALRAYREGAQLTVTVSPDIHIEPDQYGRLVLMVTVSNAGTARTTLTSLQLFEFKSVFARWRMRPSRSWLFPFANVFGTRLPYEIDPGQRWIGGTARDDELDAVLRVQHLYVAVYHAVSKRPRMVKVPKPHSEDSRT